MLLLPAAIQPQKALLRGDIDKIKAFFRLLRDGVFMLSVVVVQ
jgi:hypothetical protein